MPLDTVAELLTEVERLPEPARTRARARVEDATELPAPACRAALGLLALELVSTAPTPTAQRLSA